MNDTDVAEDAVDREMADHEADLRRIGMRERMRSAGFPAPKHWRAAILEVFDVHAVILGAHWKPRLDAIEAIAFRLAKAAT